MDKVNRHEIRSHLIDGKVKVVNWNEFEIFLSQKDFFRLRNRDFDFDFHMEYSFKKRIRDARLKYVYELKKLQNSFSIKECSLRGIFCFRKILTLNFKIFSLENKFFSFIASDFD